MRPSGREPDQLRPVIFTPDYTKHAEGSVLAEFGDTRVLCTASVESRVPPWMRGAGSGWVTGEYGMLPRATHSRSGREAARGKQGGRTVEIQRLIGRSLRAVMDLKQMTERTIWIDCDVIQADGGTRTAAISGAYVALHDLLTHMDGKRILRGWPLKTPLAAVSVGVVDGTVLCDLAYSEDSRADVDLNLVMTGGGEFIEVQGSAEGAPFSREFLDAMLETGEAAIRRIFEVQRSVLESA